MNKTQLKIGQKVEREHSPTVRKLRKNPDMPSEEIYKNIAIDHLNEYPDYYTGLEKMENELEMKKKEREKRKTAFEHFVVSFANQIGIKIISESTNSSVSTGEIENRIHEYIKKIQQVGDEILKHKKRYGLTEMDIIALKRIISLNTNIYAKKEIPEKTKKIFDGVIKAKNALYKTFSNVFKRYKKLNPSDKNFNISKNKEIKSLRGTVAAIMNSIRSEYSYRDLFGYLTQPAKMVLIDLLKEHEIEIPVRYTSEGSENFKNVAISNQLNPVYPFHLLYNFIGLQTIDKFLSGLDKNSPLFEKFKSELISAVTENNKTAEDMAYYINNGKFELKNISINDDFLTKTTYSDTTKPSISSLADELVRQKHI